MLGRTSVDERRVKPPRLQTSIPRPSTAPHSGTPTTSHQQTSAQLDGTPEQKETASHATKPTHQPFVLTDPVAFRYLEEDSSTTVLERRAELRGYECYIVEQWTTSRSHPTFVITTHTGDTSHAVIVGVLNVPTDETTWSPRLRVYFKALNQYHAKRRETPLGILFVTNLSGFPSSLTVIAVPDGDLRKHRSDFFVNENLKRLGCSGRVGLQLSPPTGATAAKFHQLYRTSDKNEIYQSVIELVKLCQSALLLFDKLQIDYADGLLCDVTERAINDWWVEIGNEQYNVEPHDGILGPTTVAGLLGLLMGARNRLHAVNAPVAKDAFDVEAMKRGISHFQKQQRVTRTRRLDRRTLERLHRATQKAADHEGWTMPKAVKSTMAELSGKGGEMVMDAVGRRDRAGIAEIETCDMERFVQLVYGSRPKWLWLGKPLKKQKEPTQTKGADGREHGGLVFGADDHGGFTWTARKSTANGVPNEKHEPYNDVASPAALEEDSSEDEDPRFKSAKKRASELKNDARSGFDKVKGAVGLRRHQSKPSQDESPSSPPTAETAKSHIRPPFLRSPTSPISSSPNSPTSPPQSRKLDAAILEQRSLHATHLEQHGHPPSYNIPSAAGPHASKESLPPPSYMSKEQQDNTESSRPPESDPTSEQPSETVTADPSIAGSIYDGVDLNEAWPTGPEAVHNVSKSLRRTLSLSHVTGVNLQPRSDNAYPRHLSFSLAEDSVLTWEDAAQDDSGAYYDDAKAQLADEELLAKQAKHLRLEISDLSIETANWTQDQLRTLQDLLQQADRDQQALDAMHGPHLEAVHALQTNSESLLREQRDRLEEGGKEIETLVAKLEYEINGLRSKLEDVDAGVGDFEKGVSRVEERVAELEKDGEKRSTWGCVVC